MTNPNTDNEKAGGVNLFLTGDQIAHVNFCIGFTAITLPNHDKQCRDLHNAIKSQIGGQS